jgi:hypothetical protein
MFVLNRSVYHKSVDLLQPTAEAFEILACLNITLMTLELVTAKHLCGSFRTSQGLWNITKIGPLFIATYLKLHRTSVTTATKHVASVSYRMTRNNISVIQYTICELSWYGTSVTLNKSDNNLRNNHQLTILSQKWNIFRIRLSIKNGGKFKEVNTQTQILPHKDPNLLTALKWQR